MKTTSSNEKTLNSSREISIDLRNAPADSNFESPSRAIDLRNAPADSNFKSPTMALAWEGPAIGLLDLDSFFASVEQLDHPEWRGKPVIVGGSADKRGVVSTASYEARSYGVHSAMPAAQAKRLCPNAIWTQGNFARYREMSAQVMQILVDETPFVEQVSIDEAFFDLTSSYAKESPIEVCMRIQERVAELGITCSIGLSSTKSVAKIASECEKPRGLTVVLPGSEADFLAPLDVKALSGVGNATQAHLARLGIRTLGELAKADDDLLKRELGVWGPKLAERARAEERSVISLWEAPDEVKSVSNERTFAQDLHGREAVESAIAHVAGLVARRLRKKDLVGKQLTLKVRTDFKHTKTTQVQLPAAINGEEEIARLAQSLLDNIWNEDDPVRLVGVGLSKLEHASKQTNRQTTRADKSKQQSLEETADALREKFGANAVVFGRDMRFKDAVSNTQPKGRSHKL